MKLAMAAVCGLLALACLTSAPARPGNRPEGTWLSEDGGLKVRIGNCGGNRICGWVAWLGEPNDPATGKPKTDIHNPDKAKRSRPLIGLRVGGFKPDGANQWAGSIYNADDGHTYRAYLITQDDGTLRLQGCVLHVLCRGHTWTRTSLVAHNTAFH